MNRSIHRFLLAIAAASSTLLAIPVTAATTISQTPLFVAKSVPGNLVLTPSVEWPTIISRANLGQFSQASAFTGYFDSAKCYLYHYDADEKNRYFYPSRVASDCNVAGEWSGNFLNWSLTQTIDPFRKGLTGGYRVGLASDGGVEVASATYLEKARHHDANNGVFPVLTTTFATVGPLSAISPFGLTVQNITTRIRGLGNRMYFTRAGSNNAVSDTRDGPSRVTAPNNGQLVAYDPSVHDLSGLKGGAFDTTVYEVSARVKVCDASVGLEANCQRFPAGNYKPVGLLQEYSDRMTFSIFGYLNDSSKLRDGGVMRASRKFVGPKTYLPTDPTTGATNPRAEWDENTGVFIKNPDPTAASETAANIVDSGVINYLNKFGQMTNANPKSHDPVSELYYAATRYLKNQGNVASYSSGVAGNYAAADGFPVISQWSDPVQFTCQTNGILGIGDVNTWVDKNLPGNTVRTDEPTVPDEVSADTTVNVVTATDKIASIENITLTAGSGDYYGRQNSAYIAGLAYDNHTKDMRPDLTGRQTASTYWVDVRENEILEGRQKNMFWLAAKYGGFRVPEGFDPYANSVVMLDEWWAAPNETLSNGLKRPTNFYVASEADKMIESLRSAFRSFYQETRGSASALASTSSEMQVGTRVFQTQYFSGTWRGEINAYDVDVNAKTLVKPPAWRAGDKMPLPANRTILVSNKALDNGTKGTLVPFLWSNLGTDKQGKLRTSAVFSSSELSGFSTVDGDIVDYMRGVRTKEQSAGPFRTRSGILGDIVNSEAVYVGTPDPTLYSASSGFAGSDTYAAFVASQGDREPMLYVGANDGMMHGFQTTDTDPTDAVDPAGREAFAFVPNAAISGNVGRIARPDFKDNHFFNVDGELTAADVYFGSAWHTVLVGTMGRGGKGVYALDVTDPSAPVLLWEKNQFNDTTVAQQLGNNLTKPVIAQVEDGTWKVLLANGPNASDGSSRLLMFDVATGSLTSKVADASGAGLTGLYTWDSDNDGFTDMVYGGDISGGLYRFGNVRAGASATVTKLFQTQTGQPITANPRVFLQPGASRPWIYFGTGRYLDQGDLTDTTVQSWYGLKDENSDGTFYRTSAIALSDLYQSGIEVEVAETTKPLLDSSGAAVLDAEGNPVMVTDKPARRVVQSVDATALTNKSGWYINLVPPSGAQQGERMVLENSVKNGPVLEGITRVPDSTNPCSPTGRGWSLSVNPYTGGRLDTVYYDVNGDGQFNSQDEVETTDGSSVGASGLGFSTGLNNVKQLGSTNFYNTDSGETAVVETGTSNTTTSRTSWREIIQ